MKDFRFYAARDGKQDVIAVYTATPPYPDRGAEGGLLVEGATAVFDADNSPVCWSGVSLTYLRENYKRVSEAKAREIHPQLFAYLDYNP